MAISTSPKSGLSQAPPAADQGKKASSFIEEFVKQARSLSLFQQSRQITEKERIFLFSQLALMLETGTPLNRSLTAITTQIKSPFFKSVIEDIIQEVEAGKNFSTAMTKYEKEFSPITINMIRRNIK